MTSGQLAVRYGREPIIPPYIVALTSIPLGSAVIMIYGDIGVFAGLISVKPNFFSRSDMYMV